MTIATFNGLIETSFISKGSVSKTLSPAEQVEQYFQQMHSLLDNDELKQALVLPYPRINRYYPGAYGEKILGPDVFLLANENEDRLTQLEEELSLRCFIKFGLKGDDLREEGTLYKFHQLPTRPFIIKHASQKAALDIAIINNCEIVGDKKLNDQALAAHAEKLQNLASRVSSNFALETVARLLDTISNGSKAVADLTDGTSDEVNTRVAYRLRAGHAADVLRLACQQTEHNHAIRRDLVRLASHIHPAPR